MFRIFPFMCTDAVGNAITWLKMSKKTATEVKAFGPVGRSSVWSVFWAFGVRFRKPHRGLRSGGADFRLSRFF